MSTVSEREVGGERPLVGDTVRLWAVVSRRRHVGHPGVCLSACTACVRGHFQAQGCRCFCSRASKEEPISTLAGSYPWLGELGLAYHSHGYGEACGSVRLATWNADLCLSFLSFSLATGYHGWNNEASYPAARPHSCFLGDGALSPLSLRMWASSVPDADQRGCVQVKVECGLRLGNGCASCGSAKGVFTAVEWAKGYQWEWWREDLGGDSGQGHWAGAVPQGHTQCWAKWGRPRGMSPSFPAWVWAGR